MILSYCMCGIYGVILNQELNSNYQKLLFSDIKSNIENLFTQSLYRGSEAAGISACFSDQNKHYFTAKVAKNAHSFLSSKEYTHFVNSVHVHPVQAIIGHSRLATNGSHTVQKNNQPVVSAQKLVVGVHNGIVTNFEEIFLDLKLKEKNRSAKNVQIPELDTQVVLDYLEFLLIEHTFDVNRAIKELFRKIEGTANLALFIPKIQTTILATNCASLHYVQVPFMNNVKKSSLIYFASESMFIQNALKIIPKRLESNSALIIEAQSQKIIQLDPYVKSKLKKSQKEIVTRPAIISSQNSIGKLKKHTIDFERIKAIPRCSRCILPATTPFITFDSKGVCNYCHEHKPITNKGPEALEKILKKYRKNTGEPDCIVAFSGGRDSSYGLHLLTKELGMHPITFTYDWGMISDLGRRNQARVLGKLGVEQILKSANIDMKRKHIRQNILAWMKKPQLGMIPLFMQGDKQCEYFADQAKRNYDLPLMIYCRGNELEKEEFKTGHCGVRDADPGGVIHNLATINKLKLLKYFGLEYLKNPAYINDSFLQTALGYISTYWQPHDYIYLWHYLDWDEKTIEKTLTKEYNWEMSSETTTSWRIGDGTPPFYNYIYCQVQGFTENDSLRARQVREGIITRREALGLVYSENQPQYGALTWYFDTIGIDGDAVLTVVDGMRKLY